MLFEKAPKFKGLPEDGFETFAIVDKEERRRAIVEIIHPALSDLGEDLIERLGPLAAKPLHAHLPRLDWPREYQPFATWLALSHESAGYQAGPQLNLGVHADHVTARLGWDTSADTFGRFEFLCRHGEIGEMLLDLAAEEDLRIRVYAPEPWPAGSRCVVESPHDLSLSFDEVRRRGVWWELGRRYGLPGAKPLVCAARYGDEVARIFAALLPAYERISGLES